MTKIEITNVVGVTETINIPSTEECNRMYNTVVNGAIKMMIVSIRCCKNGKS